MLQPMRRNDLLAAVLTAGSVSYPFLVYFALPRASSVPLVLLAIVLCGLRLMQQRHRGAGLLSSWDLTFIPCVMLVLLAVHPILAAQAYPPLVCLVLATTFARSLRYPPTVVERIARLTIPHPSPTQVAYMRNVTTIWVLFLLANASIACAFSLWFSVQIWTLWTGFVSYLLIGALFAGEIVVRRWRFRREAL